MDPVQGLRSKKNSNLPLWPMCVLFRSVIHTVSPSQKVKMNVIWQATIISHPNKLNKILEELFCLRA